MKRTASLTALIAGSASAALAGSPAPAPDPEPEPTPPAPQAYDWTGPFLGLRAGFANGEAAFSRLAPEEPPITPTSEPLIGVLSEGSAYPEDYDHDIDGVFGGIYGGYDLQRGDNVFGIDAAYNIGDISGSGGGETSFETEIESFGSIRARYGRAMDDVLFYGAAGFAFADADATITERGFEGEQLVYNDAVSLSGYTAALGVQRAMPSGWSFRGEVAYTDYDEKELGGEIASEFGPTELEVDMTTFSVGVERRF